MYLRGLRYVYQFNVFLYMMLGVAGVSLLWMVVRGAGGPWRRKKAGELARARARMWLWGGYAAALGNRPRGRCDLPLACT